MNMKPEYRAELKALRKARAKVLTDHKKVQRNISKQITALNRIAGRAEKRTRAEVARISRRELILEGRLS